MKKYKVYILREKSGKKVYVGQTRQTLSRRLSGHKQNPRFPHYDITIELVADFDKPEPMYQLEAMLIEQYNLIEEGWNKSAGYKDCPDQFDQTGEKNGFYGHKHSNGVCESLGQRSLGNSYAKGNKSRTGLTNSKKWHEAITEKKSKSVICLNTGEVFKSGREAANKLNLSRSKVSLVANGKRPHTKGYKFKFVDKGSQAEMSD